MHFLHGIIVTDLLIDLSSGFPPTPPLPTIPVIIWPWLLACESQSTAILKKIAIRVLCVKMV